MTAKFLLFCLSLFLYVSLVAQSIDREKQELAFEYLRNKEFDKAATLFNELYQMQRNTFYFTYYIYSLNQSAQYDEAERAIKKEIKKNPSDISFKIMLGNVYKLMNRLDDMKKTYDDVIKSIEPNQSQIFQAANMFITYQEYDLAETVYLKGQKLLKGTYSFRLELANLYQIQKLYSKMIDEYLALLNENPNMIQMVQNRLQQSVYNQEDKTLVELLQNKLIQQIQKSPDVIIFSEFLIWLYNQQNKFNLALTYAISLDKRLKEDGSRIYSIGQTAFANKDYNTALKAFQYIIQKGYQSAWYEEAKSDYLVTLYYQIIEDKQVDKNKILELEKELTTYLTNSGIHKNTFSVSKILAQLKAFYLNKPDESIELLKKIISSNAFSAQQINEVKILLGDIMLMKNDIWEATLLYTQVEKNSPNEPIAHEARFKKAILAYYTGDFLWAQAQANVLKASTSKLIANDALALSQFIDENLETDSTQQTLKTFSLSDFYVFKKQDSLALLCLDSILNNPSAYSLHDDALLKKADIYSSFKKFDISVALYDSVIQRFGREVSAPQAAYRLANLYQYTLNNKELAKKYLEIIFNNYPGSFYSNEARRRFRILRGDIIDEFENKDTYSPLNP
ncbi:MAG: tetratricopeptide repeat protein [Bacteroidales bacterium]|nr:tetratricopeptide repeat protein [Bacteroidales bacterium]